MAARPRRCSPGLAGVLLLPLAALTLAGCRTTKVLTGRVLDYDTRKPIAAASARAEQHGWGWSDGPVLDKTDESTAVSDAAGHFSLRYNVGSTANLIVVADGYSEWRHAYEAGDNAEVLLRARPSDPIRSRQLSLGLNADGSRFGWRFSSASTTTDQAIADIFPDAIGADGKTLHLVAGQRGGLRFRSRHDLGVDADVLIFAPPAPPDGYLPSVTLTFGAPDSRTDGVYFVRTGDGEHFAKFEVGPELTIGSDPGVRQSFRFTYVYDPTGGRALPFEHVPLASVR